MSSLVAAHCVNLTKAGPDIYTRSSRGMASDLMSLLFVELGGVRLRGSVGA